MYCPRFSSKTRHLRLSFHYHNLKPSLNSVILSLNGVLCLLYTIKIIFNVFLAFMSFKILKYVFLNQLSKFIGTQTRLVLSAQSKLPTRSLVYFNLCMLTILYLYLQPSLFSTILLYRVAPRICSQVVEPFNHNM